MSTYAKIANLFVAMAAMVLLFVCVLDPSVNGDAAGAGGIGSALLCYIGLAHLTYNRER